MLSRTDKLDKGLAMRPANPGDAPFIESLFHSTRNDLRMLDAEDEFIDALIEMQYKAQTQGYGDMFPNAMYFIVEHLGERIGRVTLDFGSNEIRVVDLALIPAARGKGFGTSVLQYVQLTAQKIMVPVALSVAATNFAAAQLYRRLGFQVVESDPMQARMMWYPSATGTH